MNRTFNPDMLILARAARGFTQAELLEKAPIVTQGTLSKIEAGFINPSNDVVEAVATALDFKPGFFYKPHSRRSLPVAYNRKRQKLAKTIYERLFAQSQIIRISISDMLNSVELSPKRARHPSIDPDEYRGDIETIASTVRQYWGVPRGSLDDVTSLIESSGIIVVPVEFGTGLIDGFSQHSVDGFPPVIFVNKGLRIDRLRFTLCHELGHLIMHLLPNPNMEEEANKFAAAFLMPKDDIRHEFHSMSLERLMMLKLTWKTAMSAIIRRARDLGKISDSSYKYYVFEMQKRGWRVDEPVQITEEIEKPKILKQLVSAHLNKLGYSIEELSNLFGWNLSDTELLYSQNRPKLRLVG